MKIRPLILATAVGLASVTAVTTTACAPPPAVHALVQHTACNTTYVGDIHHTDGCVHWINHEAAWDYPPNTEWVGPFSDFLYDVIHGNGAELLS